jgi:3-oxoacyl-[acyl-carrier-protein] synthase III
VAGIVPRGDRHLSLPELYISRPGIALPSHAVDNTEILRRVREQYRGAEEGWADIASAIGQVFELCNTKVRYLDSDPQARVADYAVEAAQKCLALNGVDASEVDLVINGSIARQYFEPATAMEIAAKLGLKRTHAFDVTAACVGHLEAIQAAAAYFALHDEYRTALICTSELFRHFVSYDVQAVKDLYYKSAGLTVGNAAACVLLRRDPWPHGGIRLLKVDTHAVPDHWHLCQVPIDGHFESSSVELMRLGKLIPPWLINRLDTLGWSPRDVAHYVFHQPSDRMIRKLLEDVNVDPSRGVYTHSLYGNTASAAVAVTLHRLLEERAVQPGDKMVLGSAAAGFAMVFVGGVWDGPTNYPKE